jgi:O-antigen/teichoic acid export membrane protein
VSLRKRVILPNSEKVKSWLKLITITGTAQVIVQAVGFLSGILVIRLLSVDEYALYTLANTMLGTMTVLSDGGISTGVMAQGGKVWQDKHKLGAVLATGLDLRRKFTIFSLVVSIPILGYLLLHHGASWIMAILITASLIPAFYASLSDNLLEIPVKLHQAIVPLQKNQVEVGVGRLILTGITLFIFPWAFVAIIANGIPRIWGNVKLRKIADRFVVKDTEVNAGDKKEIFKIIKRVMPDAIYYSFSGQVTLWLISIFGSTASVAELGALGRLSAILTILTLLLGTLVIPRFAKYDKNRNLLAKKSVIFISITILLLVVFIFATYLFSDIILMILGNSYYGLNNELLLSVISSSIFVVTGLIFGLSVSRGWPAPPLLVIVAHIVFIIAGIFLFEISTLSGILQLGIFTNISLLLTRSSYLFYKIRTL